MITMGTFKRIESMLADEGLPHFRIFVNFRSDGKVMYHTYQDSDVEDDMRARSQDFGKLHQFWTGERFIDPAPAAFLDDEAIGVLCGFQRSVRARLSTFLNDGVICLGFYLGKSGVAEPSFRFAPPYDNALGLSNIVKFDYGEFVAAMSEVLDKLPKAEKAA